MDRDEPSNQKTASGQQIQNNAPVQGQNIAKRQKIEKQVFHLPGSASTPAAPSPLAPLWTVPLLRNPHFTGRDELLARLEERLSSPAQGEGQVAPQRAALTQPQAITGLGGIGKTQLAVEYAYRSREQGRYTHTLWINAASEETIISSFVALAEKVLPKEMQSETDQRKLVEAVKVWLERCEQPWLLICDNADEPLILEPYLPRVGNGSILLTTRAHAVGALAVSLVVENMGLMEGVELLLRRAQRNKKASPARAGDL